MRARDSTNVSQFQVDDASPCVDGTLYADDCELGMDSCAGLSQLLLTTLPPDSQAKARPP